MSGPQNSISQDEIDREQMKAGLKLSQALIDNAMLDGNLTEEKRRSLMEHCQKLCLPERFKDISVKELNEMTMSNYITDASVMAIKNRKERTFVITVAQNDGEILKDLSEHWISKGFKVEQSPDNLFIFKLSW
jgi:hypothetical protein